VRDVLDNTALWSLVVAAAADPEVGLDEAKLAQRLRSNLDSPASELVDAIVQGGFLPGGDALHARLDGLLSAASH
jgi:hypothetical protein